VTKKPEDAHASPRPRSPQLSVVQLQEHIDRKADFFAIAQNIILCIIAKMASLHLSRRNLSLKVLGYVSV